MEYQQQQFTPYDPYASYGAQSVSASTSSVRQSQSPTMSNAYPAYSTSGAHGNGANAYPSVPQPRQQQQQQQLQQHEHRGFNLQAIAPMVGSRDSSSGPARQGATHRREYSTGAGNGVPHAAGGGGRGPYARPSEPAPLSAREGAGPGTVKASSTTSEFTKRKNWSQHIIDEIQDFMHVLAPDRTVMFAAPSIQDLTGWSPDEVTGHPISDFIHADDVESFLRDFDASLRDGSELNVYYRFRMKDDRYTIFEIAGHAYYAVDEVTGERKCKCFFGMGRPYPSKNTAMLDSFLELKMENERLRQELQVMYRDIEGGSSYSPYPGQGRNAFPSPFSNHDVALGHSPPQFEPRSGAGVIDPATGLVQTSGLIPSSSNTYGALGIGISQTGAKGEGVPGDKKKKKPRVEEGDFVCRDCGTVDSPEWRKGPEGPKSLCNACGLRYAKLRSKDKLKGEVK